MAVTFHGLFTVDSPRCPAEIYWTANNTAMCVSCLEFAEIVGGIEQDGGLLQAYCLDCYTEIREELENREDGEDEEGGFISESGEDDEDDE